MANFASKYNFEARLLDACEKRIWCPRMRTLESPLTKSYNLELALRSRKDSGDSVTSRSSSRHTTLSVGSAKTKNEFIDPLGAALDPLILQAREESDGESVISASLSQRLLGIDVNHTNNDRAGSGAILTNTLSERLSDEQREALMDSQEVDLAAFTKWATHRDSILNSAAQSSHKFTMPKAVGNNGPSSDLNYAQYLQMMKQTEFDLKEAWNEDKRVEALKIVIHTAGLLSNTTCPKMYNVQFVLVTRVLDLFGSLVFERLWMKSNAENKKLSKPELHTFFDGDDVGEAAKEIGRNWWYKIASIRELLARIYCEISIVKCIPFCHSQVGAVYTEHLSRLARCIRGVGDPLVAAYAYVYLCRVGMQVCPQSKDHIWVCLHSCMISCKHAITWHQLGVDDNIRLLHFPMRYVLECLVYNCTPEDLLPIWEWVKAPEKQTLLINPILDAFPPKIISRNAVDIGKVILSHHSSAGHKYLLCEWLCKLGKALLIEEPDTDMRRPLVREVWRLVKKMTHTEDYLGCARVWIEFACTHLGARDVNSLLEDIVEHVKPDKIYANHLPVLLSVLGCVVRAFSHLSVLFSLDQFVEFLQILQSDEVALPAARCVLEGFIASGVPCSDSGLANHIVQLCRTVHDSLNALALQDERTSSETLICKSLMAVSLFDEEAGVDAAERELQFAVECRASFCNLDAVVQYLVGRVHALAMRLREQMGGKLSRRSAGVVRSCVAYSYITTPSIGDVFVRMPLHMECASVALVNACLPQADAVLKAAISEISTMPSVYVRGGKRLSAEPMVVEYVCNLLSMLVVVPDPPDCPNALYLFNGLYNATIKFEWKESTDGLSAVHCAMLRYLAAVCQPEYSYHLPNVVSNDSLYGSSHEFISAVKAHANTVMAAAINRLTHLANTKQFRRQASVALDLAELLLQVVNLNEPSMLSLARNLCNLANKTGAAHAKRIDSLVKRIQAYSS